MTTACDIHLPDSKFGTEGKAMDRRRVIPISLAAAAGLAGVGVIAAGYTLHVAGYGWAVGSLFLLAAYSLFTQWLQEAGDSGNGAVRALNRLRRAIAYDPAPVPTVER
jgi:hypothetical protein